MMRPGVLTVCIVFASASAAAQAQQAAAFAEVGPAQIRAVLSGKYVTDDHQSAHHQGRVKPGRWAVRDKQLCLTIPETGRQPECFAVHRQGDELQYRDERGYMVWQGFIRNKAGTHLFEGVVDPTPAVSKGAP
jgi:hypothetical protein